MRNKKLAGICVGLFMLAPVFTPAAAGAGTAGAISLEDAVTMALENRLNLGAAEARIAETEAGLDRALAARWPNLVVSAGGTRLSEMFPGSGPIDKYSTGFKLSWPLFTGGRTNSGIAMAQLGLEVSRTEYENQRAQTVYGAASGYINLLKAGGMAAISRRQVETVREHLKMVELKYELGAATKTDLLETQIRLSQAEQALARTQHGKTLAGMNLRNLLGLPEQEELVLSGLPGISQDFPLPSLEQATGIALESRDELVNLRHYQAIAEENLRAAGGFWKPTLALVGSYGADQRDALEFTDPTWSLTLALEASLFSGGGNRAMVREKEAAVEKAAYSYRQAAEGIKLEMKQRYLAVTEAAQARELAALTLKQAEENYEFTRARYELGAAQNLEVLIAQNTLYQCRFDELAAGYDYFLAIMELYRAMGRMEKFLEEVSPDA